MLQYKRHNLSLDQWPDLQVKLGDRYAAEAVLSKATDLNQAILTEGEVPGAVIVAVTLFEEISPLTSVQAWKVLRLAFAIVALHAFEELRGFLNELHGVTRFMFFDLNQIVFRKSNFLHSSLPACAAPSFKVFIHSLAFRSAQSQDTNHLVPCPNP